MPMIEASTNSSRLLHQLLWPQSPSPRRHHAALIGLLAGVCFVLCLLLGLGLWRRRRDSAIDSEDDDDADRMESEDGETLTSSCRIRLLPGERSFSTQQAMQEFDEAAERTEEEEAGQQRGRQQQFCYGCGALVNRNPLTYVESDSRESSSDEEDQSDQQQVGGGFKNRCTCFGVPTVSLAADWSLGNFQQQQEQQQPPQSRKSSLTPLSEPTEIDGAIGFM
uniref:MsrB domain-containing protein n=1 Tax=Macrostomum lignano TaxID=282301 RepID=A0A1I8HBG6_9PLAT